MRNNIDIVIAYVNPSVPEWKEQAEKYGVLAKDSSSGAKRFRDDGTLELCLASIKKFCGFYDNIYLVVSSQSQVPDYAKETVKVIEHKDFIPEEYLPCFSSCAIETFFPFLPIRNERFVYFNDDMILTSKVNESHFFNGDSPLATIKRSKRKVFYENLCLLNSYNLIMRTAQKADSINSHHCPTGFNKRHLQECWKMYSEELLKRVHPLGRTEDDVSQYVYSFYDFCYHFAGYSHLRNVSLTGGGYNRFDWQMLGHYNSICMNAVESGSIQEYVNKVKQYIYEQ